MDQRRLRLGDILDDYCPRERRVTNHAVVAMIEEDVKQTRCTTCDTEHVYKGGKAPRRKKSESTGALYKEVLAGITDDASAPTLHDRADPAPPAEPIESIEPDEAIDAPIPAVSSQPQDDAPHDDAIPDEPEEDEPQPADDGPVHRPLIRAQLPRPEGVKIERQAPDFTIRQGGRGSGSFRGSDARGRGGRPGAGGGGHNNNGHRFGRGPNRGDFGRGPRQGGNGPRKRGR
jgi:hypothetical protein